MYSAIDDPSWHGPGSPIQKSLDLSLFSGSPRLIAANHVFHRLLAPRHSPCAHNSLTIKLKYYFAQLLQHSQYAIVKEQLHSIKNEKLKTKKYPIHFSFLIFHSSLFLVEVNGIEPMTSCVQSRRSPNWATPPTSQIENQYFEFRHRQFGGPR